MKLTIAIIERQLLRLDNLELWNYRVYFSANYQLWHSNRITIENARKRIAQCQKRLSNGETIILYVQKPYDQL
jgi:hypothetical protein